MDYEERIVLTEDMGREIQCPHLKTTKGGQLAIGCCNKYDLVDMNCDEECPDKYKEKE